MAIQSIETRQKIVILILSLVFIQVVIQLFFAEEGLRSTYNLSKRREASLSKLRIIEAANQQLENEIVGLKTNPKTLEEHVRYQMGMIGNQEKFVILVHGS